MAADDPQWNWWREALRGDRGPINANEPMSGFYRLRRKDKATGVMINTVAAFWREGRTGILRCKQNRRMLSEIEALELWPFASKNPIAHAAYQAFMREGNWVRIVDYPACLNHFAQDAKVMELVRQLANAAAVSGMIPAGCIDPTQGGN